MDTYRGPRSWNRTVIPSHVTRRDDGTVLELPCALGYAALIETDKRTVKPVVRNRVDEHVLRRP